MRRSASRRFVAIGVAALVVVSTAACGGLARGGGEDNAAPPTTVHDHGSHSHKPAMDPCTLLTAEEATKAVGPVVALVENTGEGQAPVPDSRICVVATEGNKLAAHVGFTEQDVKRTFIAYTQRFAKASEPVDSLGDYAAWVSIFRLLMVLKGGELLTVQMLDPNEELPAAKDKAIKLARAAVPRLPERPSS